MNKFITILGTLTMTLSISSAWAEPASDVLEKVAGRWDMNCKSEKIQPGVTGIVPQWYQDTKEINFFKAEPSIGIGFLNVSDSLPNVGGVLRLSLPIFYTLSGHSSSHTYSENTVSSESIKNETHVCNLEFDAFGGFGVKPDIASSIACSAQKWRNSTVTKEVVLNDVNSATLKITTHYGDPAEDNSIVCSLVR